MTSPNAPVPDRPTARHILLLLLVGAVGGTFSGAFGVGGGVIMVPLMLLLLGFDQRRAAATSLAAVVLSSISGTIIYTTTGHIDLIAGLLVGAGGIAGSIIGSRLLRRLPLAWLRWGFVVLLAVIAVRMFLTVPVRGEGFTLTVPIVLLLLLTGICMGVAAGLFGVGGGVLIVPVFVAFFGVSDLIAKGTSLLAMIPASVTGTVANIRGGLVTARDGVLVGAVAVAFSFGGAMIALLMPPAVSSTLFGVFVAVIVIQLTIRAIRQHRAAE